MLIVNADDFGLSININRGIIETIEKGVVNSVSLVANGNAIEEAAAYLSGSPQVNAGIHLTLIEEKPVCDPRSVRSLTDENGRLVHSYKDFIARYLKNEINYKEIRSELDAQFAALRDLGVRLSHCDSHQHIHLLPKISDLVLDLCREHGIKRIRIVNEAPSPGALMRIIPLVAMNLFSQGIRKTARMSGISTADRFIGFNTSMHVTEAIIQKARKLAESKVVELMCHPGYNQADNMSYGHWHMDWDRERKTLLSAFSKE
jgi:chitin disaccharide deacetylase